MQNPPEDTGRHGEDDDTRRSRGSRTSPRPAWAAARLPERRLRAAREPAQAESAVFVAEVHLARQVDGRLGIAAQADAGPRLVRDCARCAGGSTAWTSTRASSRATSRRPVPSTPSTCRGRCRRALRAGRAPWTTILAASPLQPNRHHLFAIDQRRSPRDPDPPSPQHLPRRRRRAVPRTARWPSTGRESRAPAARSISPASGTAGSCSAPATCTSAPATT